MARIWLEFARYYVALDPFAFQVPREDGLADWFERETARAKSADQRALVAEVDGVIAGFAAGSIRGLRRTPSISSSPTSAAAGSTSTSWRRRRHSGAAASPAALCSRSMTLVPS